MRTLEKCRRQLQRQLDWAEKLQSQMAVDHTRLKEAQVKITALTDEIATLERQQASAFGSIGHRP